MIYININTIFICFYEFYYHTGEDEIQYKDG